MAVIHVTVIHMTMIHFEFPDGNCEVLGAKEKR